MASTAGDNLMNDPTGAGSASFDYDYIISAIDFTLRRSIKKRAALLDY